MGFTANHHLGGMESALIQSCIELEEVLITALYSGPCGQHLVEELVIFRMAIALG